MAEGGSGTRWDDAPLPELPIRIRVIPITHHLPKDPPVYSPRTSDIQRAAIERVIEAIALDPADRWEVDDMARIARFSKYHFTRLFDRYTGMPPHRWLLHYRIELAKELLTRPPFPKVAGVTRILGYDSIGTFSSRFTKTVGCTPTAYRRWHAHAEELTVRAGYQGQFYRDAAAVDCSLSPRWLPSFDETIEELARQLTTPVGVC